jgi:hypothetical protein
LLDSSVDELREIGDLRARLELSESVVKLLAASKPDRCRRLLDSLFDDALRLRSAKPRDGDARRSLPDPDLTIRKIIQIAGGFDRKLAQSYINTYTGEGAAREGNEGAPDQPPQLEAALYLKLALELVERDPALASSVAIKGLRSAVPYEAIIFLGALRKKDVGLADRVFADALQSIRARGGRDINELLLLYSYVFSPLQVLQAAARGIRLSDLSEDGASGGAYRTDPALALHYLETARYVLLNSARYDPGNVERLRAGPAGDFLFINIIEPQVAVYLPDLAQPLSMQRSILAGYLNPDQRAELLASFGRWSNLQAGANQVSGGAQGPTDFNMRLAEQTPYAGLKDELYYKAAETAVRGRKYETAIEIVEKMSSEYREKARQTIACRIAMQAARDGQVESAERWLRRGSDPASRAYVLTLIADSLVKGKSKDTVRAVEFLDEAVRVAQTLDGGERVAVLTGVTLVLSRFDAARAHELLREVVKAANKIEDFTGEVEVTRVVDMDGFYFGYTLYRDGEFTFTGAINQLGRADFNEALQGVQGLKSRLARLRAVVALCDGVLSGRTSEAA